MTAQNYATPFTLLHAASLLSHSSRLRKFEVAINNAVDEDSEVVDLGSGTGILALMAARAGAKKVTAIDINAESMAYAKRAAKLNGLEDNIEFVHRHFADYRPAKKANVVICEMLSSMMLIEQQVPACIHAIEHILREDGILLPSSIDVYAVPVEFAALWNRFSVSNLQFPRVPQSIERGNARDLADLSLIHSIDFQGKDVSGMVEKELRFKIIENGEAHGLVGMFEATLEKGNKLTMSDGWRELFIPFEESKRVVNGNVLKLKLKYEMGKFDSLYLR
ncbi:MAG: 50S ribosomal protein L11 methyltransferase [Candidatus Thorarchaeota archaeon]|jgi:ubiquinone/menaquinone biosynthesis C-methylase UbiE